MTILCLGTTPALQRSMVFDALTIDAVNRSSDVVEYASGKAINASRVVRTLGKSAVAMGFLGGDTGRLVRDDLDRGGIAHDFCETAARTRMCITLIDRRSGEATELVEESRAVTPDDTEALLLTLDKRLKQQAEMLVLLGSLAPGVPADFYARCTRLATAAGVRTILDAKGAALQLALSERPFIVKPNRRELEETTGSPIRCDDDLKRAIAAVIAEGPAWAIVTAGAGDVVYSDGTRFWKLVPPAVKAVSPIGSGDSLAGGIAAALCGGTAVPEACAFGVACAVANALTPLAGHVVRADVERIQTEVLLREWR